MPRVKRIFPDLPYITASVNTKIVVTDAYDYALGYTHINTLIDTIDNGGLATDGENVFTGDQLIFGNLTINGDIIANQFLVTTSSITHYTASTNFGLDSGDTHTFTGSVYITGSLNVMGGINGVINATNGVISSSAQITSFGFVSGSYETTGRGILSGSISYNNLTDIPQNIASGSYETTGRSIISSSAQITALGFISSSQTINTSSFATTGSNTFTGNQTITGSFLVSGSTTQIGNNTLLGNTVLSGSVDISGSTNIQGTTTVRGMLFVSGSTNFQNHTITMTGSMYTSGSQTITGSLDVKGNINVASGSEFYLAGNKLFNYGQFSDTTTQSGSANTAYSMRFNTTDFAHEISVVSGSRLTVANTGLYNIQFSAQLDNSSNTNELVDIWFALTGSNIANSNTSIAINKAQAGNFGKVVAAWNYMLPLSASNYVELKWSSTGNGILLSATGSASNPTRPAVPSVIATITQVA